MVYFSIGQAFTPYGVDTMTLHFEASLPVSVLTSFNAELFKCPRIFRTAWDSSSLDQKQYDKGVRIGKESEYITISERGTWSSKLLNGGSNTSYETIGYHASSAALLAGFLDSGTEVYVARESGTTRIK